MCIIDDGQLGPAAKEHDIPAIAGEHHWSLARLGPFHHERLDLEPAHDEARWTYAGVTLEDLLQRDRWFALELDEVATGACRGQARIPTLIGVYVAGAEIQTCHLHFGCSGGEGAQHNRGIESPRKKVDRIRIERGPSVQTGPGC